ncbi:MAG: MgtC/SapB family protein [Prevotella sp.]|jgi:putative Mg2+ transporter-C (MgtC) family protein
MNETFYYIIALAAAALMGGLIGFEREYRAKEAGLRTHLLVALGSALFMILSKYGFDDKVSLLGNAASFDPSRIASQVVTGIGFIGAGTIIFQKHVIRGLTTAAGLWVTAAIGMTCGAGMFILALAATVMVLICLEAMYYIHSRFEMRNLSVKFSTSDKKQVTEIMNRLKAIGADVESYQLTNTKDDGKKLLVVELEMRVNRSVYQNGVLRIMDEFNDVNLTTID